MKFLYITLLLSITSTLFSQEKATVSKNEQIIHWTGKAATGGYEPQGTLKVLSAEITYTETEITELFIVVDMRSLYHENKQLKKHLKEKDFFYVKQFPVATFILKENATIENGEVILNGEMTIKGVSKKEAIKVALTINEKTIRASFNHKMDRTLYGVNFNSPSIFTSMKENLIADEFTLEGILNFKNK